MGTRMVSQGKHGRCVKARCERGCPPSRTRGRCWGPARQAAIAALNIVYACVCVVDHIRWYSLQLIGVAVCKVSAWQAVCHC